MGESLGDLVARKAAEPSTWKGLGWILAASGILPAGAVDPVVAAGVALVGLVEVIRRES